MRGRPRVKPLGLRRWNPSSKRIALVLATGMAIQLPGCTIPGVTTRPSSGVSRPSAERVIPRPPLVVRPTVEVPRSVVERMQREITPQEYAAMLREAMAKKQAEIRRKALARQAEEEAMKKGPRPKPAQRTAGMSILFDKKPSISAEYIDWELRKHKSPAAGMGAEMVRLGERYGIDPAFALAKFRSESTYGTSGVARTTKSVGNLRGTGPAGGYKGFRRYNKWAEGLEDLYRLMAKDRRYLKAGRTTVEGIVPVYAPPHENPTGEIINRVRGFMGRYREEYQRGLHLKNSH